MVSSSLRQRRKDDVGSSQHRHDILIPQAKEWDIRKCPNLYSESEIIKMICEYISDVIGMDGRSFKQDTYFMNMRLLFGFIGIAFASYASIAVSFEKQKILLGFCAGMFFFCMILLYLMEIFWVHGASVTFFDKKNVRRFLDVSLDRKASSISLRLRTGNPKVSPSSTRTIYLGRLFDADGHLVTEEIYTNLVTLNDDFTSGKHGTVDLTDEGKREAQRESKEYKTE